jgi:hypothetical protein
MKKITIYLLLGLLFVSSGLQAQKNECRKFHLYGECRQYSGAKFIYDGQSRSNIIGVGDQLIYSLVLYGGNQYKLYFCTSDYFKPIHVSLLNGETGETMYDNKEDEYIDNLTLNIEKTQRVKVSVEIMAKDMTEEEKLEYFGCLGMLVHSKETKD